MSLDPRRLLVLRAIDRHGGVVGAAEVLRVSPSAISQQLAALERDAGVALVDRSRRGGQRPLELTAAGRRLAGYAAQLGLVLDEAEADMAAFAGAAAGPVTVAAFFTILSGYVGPALTRLARTHPGIRARVIELDEPQALPDLHAGAIDLVFVEDDAQHRRRPPAGLRYEALLDDAFRLAVPVDWPEVSDLSDIADRPWVDGPPGSALGQALARLRHTTGMAFPAAHSCTEFTAALAVVGAGLAGAFVPELALAVISPQPGVRILAPPGIGARRLGVLYRKSRHEPTPTVRAVLDVLHEVIATP
jgi:DNA-binding transcriptional LysR family regulator